ncbi:MAG: hypothetical protein K0Q50_2482 [Vampirovibrio sp.]|jgi:hypothetical protein|nr:hypothetical protein [Vampirovibrio sp.]
MAAPAKKKRRTDESRAQADLFIDLLLDEGYKSAYIAQMLSEKYHITIGQAFKDVKRVKEARSLNFRDMPLDLHFSDLKEKAELIHRQALKKGEFQHALRSLETVLKILKTSQGVNARGKASSTIENHSPTTRLAEALQALDRDGKTPR